MQQLDPSPFNDPTITYRDRTAYRRPACSQLCLMTRTKQQPKLSRAFSILPSCGGTEPTCTQLLLYNDLTNKLTLTLVQLYILPSILRPPSNTPPTV